METVSWRSTWLACGSSAGTALHDYSLACRVWLEEAGPKDHGFEGSTWSHPFLPPCFLSTTNWRTPQTQFHTMMFCHTSAQSNSQLTDWKKLCDNKGRQGRGLIDTTDFHIKEKSPLRDRFFLIFITYVCLCLYVCGEVRITHMPWYACGGPRATWQDFYFNWINPI